MVMAATRTEALATTLAGMRVLLVEDSGVACRTLGLACARSGAHVRRAGSLDAARRILAASCPDIAVVDLGLPDGSGLDLIREMSRLGTRLIAISGDDRAEGDAMAAGADTFMAKPFSGLNAILSTLHKVARKGR